MLQIQFNSKEAAKRVINYSVNGIIFFM
jgi:hypothetical protein